MPAATASCSRTLVAATTRTSMGTLLREPSRTTSRSCSTRSSLTWIDSGRSPISSRNSVPPLAASNQPDLAENAPVKAPFSWPKSSLSTRLSEKAPQFTATKGRLLRRLRSCTWRAISSLPVPVSPMMSTLASLGATMRTRSSSAAERGSWNTWAVARIEVVSLRGLGSVSRVGASQSSSDAGEASAGGSTARGRVKAVMSRRSVRGIAA